jgi:hypothetical protein
MAFSAANLALVSSVNGFGLYRYDTTDALTTVDGSGYINNTTNAQNLKVGDMIEVVVWGTAVRTGLISDVGRHIVMLVGATGDVDLSNDLTSWAPVSGD